MQGLLGIIGFILKTIEFLSCFKLINNLIFIKEKNTLSVLDGGHEQNVNDEISRGRERRLCKLE